MSIDGRGGAYHFCGDRGDRPNGALNYRWGGLKSEGHHELCNLGPFSMV